ncbi:hypothetical protein [Robinsoniella peoriensis]|uniref:Ger(x)C family spore germination protein n=1 Tax=Robinsoniella peoriensis TaxID=180332 RepID=UPI0005C7A73D|nr:hypothetical protein [Robinsoniella peoriensis]
MRKWFVTVVLMAIMLCLSGCTKRELEDRYFPLAVEVHKEEEGYRIEYALPNMGEETGQKKGGEEESEQEEKDTKEESAVGKTIEEAAKAYAAYVDKYIDSGHTKAIILGPEMLEDANTRKEMLTYFESHTSFARSISVFVYDDEGEESLVTKTASSIDSLGTYLQDLIKNNPDKKGVGTTLGDLLNFWHNNEEEVTIPQVHLKKDKPVADGEVVFISSP